MWISRKEWNALNERLNFLTRMCVRFDPSRGCEETEDSVREFPRRLHEATHMRVDRGTTQERFVPVVDVVAALLESTMWVAKWQSGTSGKVILKPKS